LPGEEHLARTPWQLHFVCISGSNMQVGDFPSRTTKFVAVEPAFAGIATEQLAPGTKAEEKMPGTRGSAMALVQYPQITGDGLGSAPRPPLRLGAMKWKNASGSWAREER